MIFKIDSANHVKKKHFVAAVEPKVFIVKIFKREVTRAHG